MILIGFTGTHGAGKGTITTYLIRKYGFAYFSVSEFLAQEVEQRGLTANRNARAETANEYRAKSPTALMEAVYAIIDPTLARVVLEPQYTPDEVYFIQSKYTDDINQIKTGISDFAKELFNIPGLSDFFKSAVKLSAQG